MSNIEEDDTLLARWLEGTLSPSEQKELEAHPDFPVFQRMVKAADRMAVPEASISDMWKKMNAQLQLEPLPRKAIGRRSLYAVLAAAAVIAALLIFFWPVSSVVMSPVPVLVQNGIGSPKEVTLPDGTMVRLNATSEIRYDSGAWSTNRILKLKGEAWFNVPKTGVPFRIETERGSVEVLGTTFSVRQIDQQFAVACYTGRVKSESAGKSVILEGGQQSDLQNGAWIAPVNTAGTEPDWKDGLSRFENASLQTVFAELERYHDVKITIDPDLKNKVFSGEILHNDLIFSLTVVCQALGLKQSRNGKVVTVTPK